MLPEASFTPAMFGIVASIAYFVWNHPIASLAIALVLLVATMLLVRLVWRGVRDAVRSLFARQRVSEVEPPLH